MFSKLILPAVVIFGLFHHWTPQEAAQKEESAKQEQKKKKPVELAALKAAVGVWDAEIEVWPEGLDQPPFKFKGVETTRAFGEYWLASDFDSEFNGQSMAIHSIVGYDIDQKKLVATVVDQGPYAAKMVCRYDAKSKTEHWTTKVKDAAGKLIVQKTTIRHTKDGERLLELKVPDQDNAFVRFMRIKYLRRKK